MAFQAMRLDKAIVFGFDFPPQMLPARATKVRVKKSCGMA